MWRIIAKALGEKSGKTNRESDYIAVLRLLFVSVNFITCFFIVAGVIHHW